MRSVTITTVGDTAGVIQKADIDQAIANITSEHDGPFEVKIICCKVDEIGKKVVILDNENNISLAVFQRNFVAVFQEDSLNVKDLIYVMDNKKLSIIEFSNMINHQSREE